MSGLHEAFDAIVADVPVYGDLDRAIQEAERDRRHRHGAVVGLAAAAAVLAVVAGIVAASRDTDTAPPVTPSPTPVTPSPAPAKSQSPETWVDTAVAPRDGYGWDVPDPLEGARDAWSAVAADHLDPTGAHLKVFESSAFGATFERPVEGSIYPAYARVGLIVDRSGLDPLDGCRYLLEGPTPSNGTESCNDERFTGPHGERARIARYGRRCGAFDGPASAYVTCGDYKVAVAVERPDGLVGYVVVDGRGMPDVNPFSPASLAAAAADPRLTLPETAFAVPSDQAVVAVVEGHFPRYRSDRRAPSATGHPGYAQTWGRLGRVVLSVQVSPAGEAPACGRSSLVDCVERRVYGADDPTTVFVGAWGDEDWADCCPRNSRADSRVFVYVGSRHTVVVTESRVVKEGEARLSAELDQRLIDLALDPRLQ
ncbi:hypothetical protein EKO23_21505 [Nocardioides guangzhouensis]|uniref:Uncharacterized protein n=1 Tax=Nocardioides guangzhouensis TaxID=2497878 RepID=A0A4Q4Z6I8_9ACTN|nr:hypothetical protein [Nocardioides guangzhouensis]RYP82564.1 hypothetical protein EKO23_21505 [Nocardioides guangzhouensis]